MVTHWDNKKLQMCFSSGGNLTHRCDFNNQLKCSTIFSFDNWMRASRKS